MSKAAVSEELVSFLHAISEDDELSTWLLSLRQLSAAARSSALNVLAAQMRAAGKEKLILAAVSEMTQPAVYEAACQALVGLRGR